MPQMLKKLIIKLVRIVNEKEEATRALQAAQQKFAAANNFRIEKVNKEKGKNE